MSIISMIAAMDEANGIGVNNQLLCYLPADLQHFKKITMDKPVIMGRHTFESIGKPLPGRLNIVLSKSTSSIPGVMVVDSFEKALQEAGQVPEVMVIGGSKLFIAGMAVAQRLYITKIHHHFLADTFFPHIDELVWQCKDKQYRPRDDKNTFDMTFCTYERN